MAVSNKSFDDAIALIDKWKALAQRLLATHKKEATTIKAQAACIVEMVEATEAARTVLKSLADGDVQLFQAARHSGAIEHVIINLGLVIQKAREGTVD